MLGLKGSGSYGQDRGLPAFALRREAGLQTCTLPVSRPGKSGWPGLHTQGTSVDNGLAGSYLSCPPTFTAGGQGLSHRCE